MSTVTLADHEKPDGNIDWDSYHKAQKENGERCYRCGEYILFGTGYQQLCHSCKNLDEEDGEVESQSFLRCPHCGHQHQVTYEDGIHDGDSHDIFCEACDKTYEITTRMEFYFTSPPLEKKEAPKEEEEPDDDD
jgi:DNA-directed RNA polymerase subunit RPC12/RpoP